MRARTYDDIFYAELQPISDKFQPEALAINGLDRNHLLSSGIAPQVAMEQATEWIEQKAGAYSPVLAAYPLSFDWTWLYWYFTNFARRGSPFGHSRCFDIKTALAVKGHMPISDSGRSRLPAGLRPERSHTHHAIDDAIAQAQIFANIFEWGGLNERDRDTR